MNTLTVLFHIARADYLERTRRYSFLITMGLVVYLCFLVNSGKIQLELGDYRGIYNSAWVGALMTLVATTFLGLFGFYLVKNTVERDRSTGVGQIIATTPISRLQYLVGKWLSNVAVLVNALAIMAFAAVVLQIWQREDPHLDLWALLSPMLFIALPLFLVIAAVAVLFETLPGLRGGLGNVVFFIAYLIALPLCLEKLPERLAPLDPSGMMLVMREMSVILLKVAPGYSGDFSLGGLEQQATQTFYWPGVAWSTEILLGRGVLLLAAIAVLLLAALFFDRFSGVGAPRRVKTRAGNAGVETQEVGNSPKPYPQVHLTPARPRYSFVTALQGELRLLLKGLPWWWYAVAAGLLAACLAAPQDSFTIVAGLAWAWPLLVWSGMGCRENQFCSHELVFTAPHPLASQLPAAWLAGVLVTALTGAGIGAHYLLANDPAGLALWLVGVLFIPTLALACGTWSGSSKLFEVVYLLIWYIGPMNGLPALNFISGPFSTLVMFAGAALALAVAAAAGRQRQLWVG